MSVDQDFRGRLDSQDSSHSITASLPVTIAPNKCQLRDGGVCQRLSDDKSRAEPGENYVQVPNTEENGLK